MYPNKWGVRLLSAAVLLIGVLACDLSDVPFIAQATVTPTRTPRPTMTPLPTATNTPAPTNTATRAPTATKTATRRPTVRPTARPPTATPKASAPQPTVSTMEFHANPPTCTHSGLTYIKGTVYLDRNDPSKRYYKAIVALGPPDASTVYEEPILTNESGEYTFILGDNGKAVPGSWGVWLVDPSWKRKSDIGGPIITNNLPADNPASCWAGNVDFWK
jgi:hypothetical protein